MTGKFAIQGNAYYSTSFDEVAYVENGLFCVGEQGMIENVYKENDSEYKKVRSEYLRQGKLRILKKDELILPGFVDLHVHAPQWAQSGTALDRPLEQWLDDYTFPLESKYEDLEFANEVYRDVVETTLNYGTTTSLYYATVDRHASALLARLCGELGQRGLVGKVMMDDPQGNPDYYMDKSPQQGIDETEKFIQEVLEFKDSYKQKVYPVVTPRFIPSCTSEGMEGLGKLAKKYDLHIQTHCSESDWAHGFVQEKCGMNDAQALDQFGLITRKTILAHAPFLEEEDRKLFAKKGASISHCPLSNSYFANSVLPVKDFTTEGVTIGLGTDISGGYSPSMYNAIRSAVISSRMLNDGVDPALSAEKRGRPGASITLNNALYLATVAGGVALDLPLGKLEKGYAFDIQVVDTQKHIPQFYEEKNEEDLLHKILLLSEQDNIKEVWVQGNRVK